MTAGERQTLHLDLSAEREVLSSLRAIRLAVRSLDGNEETFTLCLYGVTLGSDELTSEALAERVNTILLGNHNVSNDEVNKIEELKRPLIITAIVVLISVAVIVLFILRRKRKKLLKKK